MDFAIYSIPISLGLALLSISFALDSNAKMVDNANEHFLKIAVDFVEARSRYISDVMKFKSALRQKMALKILRHFLWWSKIHLVRVNELDRNLIKPENQQYLYTYFYVTLWQIFDSFKLNWNALRQADQKSIIEMYSTIRECKKKQGTEQKLMNLFERHMGKYPIESEENFFRRIKGLQPINNNYSHKIVFKLFKKIKINIEWKWRKY